MTVHAKTFAANTLISASTAVLAFDTLLSTDASVWSGGRFVAPEDGLYVLNFWSDAFNRPGSGTFLAAFRNMTTSADYGSAQADLVNTSNNQILHFSYPAVLVTGQEVAVRGSKTSGTPSWRGQASPVPTVFWVQQQDAASEVAEARPFHFPHTMKVIGRG